MKNTLDQLTNNNILTLKIKTLSLILFFVSSALLWYCIYRRRRVASAWRMWMKLLTQRSETPGFRDNFLVIGLAL